MVGECATPSGNGNSVGAEAVGVDVNGDTDGECVTPSGNGDSVDAETVGVDVVC